MKALTFVVTDRCNVSCDFCAPGCGPALRQRLTGEQMNKVVEDVARAHPLRLVVFTGGEPMLYWKDLRDTIERVRARSPLAAIRIVTNVYWATSVRRATSILSALREAGLTELNYSVDDFHQEHIPEQRIVNGVEAALALDIPVLLAHKTYPGSRSSRAYYESLLSRPIQSIDGMTTSEFQRAKLAISTGYTVPVGRGSEHVAIEEWLPDRYAADAPAVQALHAEGPCLEVLNSFRRLIEFN